jgi:AraC family transcriptional regulator, regulatory protein of adaptative response / DNA-3-methyladenine glycosylase II
MSAEDFEVLRQHMLAEISAGTFLVRGLIGKAALDERVMTAMGKVPRHEFVPVALRGMREPDAFPAADVGLMRALANEAGIRPNAAELLARAEAWRPWRAYAAQHLWAASPTASEKAA